MINSTISSSHHYYVAFLESPQIKSLSKIASLFPINPEFELITESKSNSDAIFHLQDEIPTAYGSEFLLSKNRSRERKGVQHYWYDFYYGAIDPERKLYFICYPYSKLANYLQKNFDAQSLMTNFYTAKVPDVLEYMRGRGRRKLSLTERQGFEIDITKYTAEVKEETNASSVILLGTNPLNSRIFDVLNEEKSISIEPTALKLKCRKENVGEIEVSFDSLGNFRFWLRKNTQIDVLPMIRYVFQFFSEIRSLEKRQFLSKYTYLENE